MTVYLVQKDAVQEMNISAAPNLPNVFLIDIADSEIAGVKALLHAQPSVTAEPELLPVITARIDAIDGVSAADLKLKNFPRRALRSVNLTWNDALPPGTQHRRRRLVAARRRPSPRSPSRSSWPRVSASTSAPPSPSSRRTSPSPPPSPPSPAPTASTPTPAPNTPSTTPPSPGFPVIWYGGVHVVPNQVPQFERALNASYPTITIINVAQVVESVRSVVIQIIYVIQFLSGFSIFAGIVILASSIAGTRYRRIREVVVLKTLGATRARIATIFSIEFAVLGLVAGTVGILFANIIAWAHRNASPR